MYVSHKEGLDELFNKKLIIGKEWLNVKNELLKIEGGVSWGLWGIAGTIISFILGLYDGVVNSRCK